MGRTRRAGAPSAEGAVGFFDSGLGGLCILEAFKKLCPYESTVYIADSANCPYGNRPADEIVRLSRRNTARLLRRGCKMVVVACNTATAAAIDVLRAENPEVPFIGIEPAVKPAALRSKTGVVGVLATAGTFDGRLYKETKAKFAKDVTVIATVADEFVELVESFRVCLGSDKVGLGSDRVDSALIDSRLTLNDPKVLSVVRAKIEPLLNAGCDKIVLGCTHFPHLKPVIEKVCAGRAEVIDPSDAVARQAKRVLAQLGLSAEYRNPKHVFIRT